MNSKSVTVDIIIEKCDRQYNNDYLNIGFNICYNPGTKKKIKQKKNFFLFHI